MVVEGDAAAGGGAAASGGGAMVGSLGEEVPCGGLFLPARHRSPTQRRPRLPGEEARLERNWRQDLKGQDRDWKGTPYMRAREIGGNDGAREIVARSAGGALGSRRRSGISGMKPSALSGVSWSYRDVGTWSNTVSSP